MERNSFTNSFLKDNEAAIKDNNYKLKADSSSTWSCNNQGFGDDYLAGFSWPPRSYTCSFCRREFRSAQALGGHMNVHRRDRARLRQSPPEDLHLHVHGGHGQSPFLNLNPNPNFSSSSSTTFPSPFSSPKWRVNGTLIDPLITSKAAPDSTNMMKLGGAKSVFGVKEVKDYDKFMGKKTDYVTLDLDLEIGLVSTDHSKEDLDLELRLGYSQS